MNTSVTRPGHMVPGWPKGVEAWADLPDPREQCAAFDRACAAEEAEGKRQVRFAALALAASLGLFVVWLAHVWPS